nr:hypothetical protein [Tanacetum cinerariifolium]
CDEFERVRLKLRLPVSWRGNLSGLQPCRAHLPHVRYVGICIVIAGIKSTAIRQLLVNQNQSTSLWHPHVWQDVKKHVVTKPSDTSAAKNSTVDQELSNTDVEYKCSTDEGDSSALSTSSEGLASPSNLRSNVNLKP